MSFKARHNDLKIASLPSITDLFKREQAYIRSTLLCFTTTSCFTVPEPWILVLSNCLPAIVFGAKKHLHALRHNALVLLKPSPLQYIENTIITKLSTASPPFAIQIKMVDPDSKKLVQWIYQKLYTDYVILCHSQYFCSLAFQPLHESMLVTLVPVQTLNSSEES